MSIQEHLNKIRNAVYGHEVRESIAKGIETAYDDASENGNANMEVKVARGTHPNLRSRLEEVDNKQQQNTAQLQQKVGGDRKAELEDLSPNVLGAIDGTGGPFNLLSEPQNESVTMDKLTPPIRDGLFPATNRVKNGDFSKGLTDWSFNNGTGVVSTNVLTFTGNGASSTPHIIQDIGARVIGNKYYTRALVRAITPGVPQIQLFNGVGKTIDNPVLDQWYDIDFIAQAPTNNSYISIYMIFPDATSATGKKMEVRDVIEIDLTQTYGAGREPSLEEFREKMMKFPNRWFDGTSSVFEAKKVYHDIKDLQEKKMAPEDLQEESVTTTKIQKGAVTIDRVGFVKNTINLFDGVYEHYELYGSLDYPHLRENDIFRTAVIQIEPSESYAVSVYGEKDAFRIATSVDAPDFNNPDKIDILDQFHHFNDIGRQYILQNNTTHRYLYVTVSESGQEPLLQIEKGSHISQYKPHKMVDDFYLDKKKAADNLLPVFANAKLEANPAGPRFIDYFNGKMWGYRFDGGFYHSADEGKTWTPHTLSWDHTNWSWVQRLIPTDDGEVIAVAEKQVRKSNGWNSGTVTWSDNKVTPNTNCVIPIFGFDGDGTKFIAVEYANGTPNWQYSRYVHVSVDSGETFTKVFDSLARHGADNNALTHLHAACYDPWADRFYFSEGHSPAGGLFYSDDNGATWNQAKGHRDGVLYSQGIVDKVGDTNGPTVIVATDEGLVMGSDNQSNGIFGLLRRENAEEEVVEWIYQTEYSRLGVQMFAQRGWRDPESGTVYITFRSEWDDVPPIIVAATPTQAKLAYEYPTLPVVGGADRFMAIAKTSEGRIVSNAEFNGAIYNFRADLAYPNTEISNIIKTELRKLGLLQ